MESLVQLPPTHLLLHWSMGLLRSPVEFYLHINFSFFFPFYFLSFSPTRGPCPIWPPLVEFGQSTVSSSSAYPLAPHKPEHLCSHSHPYSHLLFFFLPLSTSFVMDLQTCLLLYPRCWFAWRKILQINRCMAVLPICSTLLKHWERSRALSKRQIQLPPQ